jgi:hypothetical protein
MLFSKIGSLVFLAGVTAAQTPPGFTPEVSAHLDVMFGTKAVTTPGMSLTKAGKLRTIQDLVQHLTVQQTRLSSPPSEQVTPF